MRTGEKDEVVYRGLRIPREGGGQPVRGDVGKYIEDAGFWSTAPDMDVAKGFLEGRQGVLLEINLPKSFPRVKYDEAETEYILPRGSRMKIVNVKVKARYTHVIVEAEQP